MSKKDIIKWYHQIEISPGILTPGECCHGDPSDDYFTKRFGLYTNFEGRTVLDVGAWDGLFSFEAEKRGASHVLAIDIPQEDGGNWGGTKGFEAAKTLLKSTVEYKNCNVYNLDTLKQTFNTVFFFGVLNHLENPLHALKQIANVTEDVCLIECDFLKDDPKVNKPLFELRNRSQTDYYFVPNLKGLIDLVICAGFSSKEIIFLDSKMGRLTMKAIK